MSTQSQRDLIAIIRKIIFAGIVIMLAWLVLLGLRGAISVDSIYQLNQLMQQESNNFTEVSLSPWSWDWSKSLWTGEPVSNVISARMWPTLGYVSVISAASLLLAMVILIIGRFISHATPKPGWLVKTRGILRLVIICIIISIPIITIETLTIIYPSIWWSVSPYSSWGFILALITAATLPTWLLVQYGQGEIAGWHGTPSLFDSALWRHLAITLGIRVLKLVGAIIVISFFVGLSTTFAGFSRTFIDAISRRDFPIIYSTVFVLIIFVVIVKLIAELLEIVYRRYRKQTVIEVSDNVSPGRKFTIPRWFIITSLVFVAITIIVAIVAPLLTPYQYNEMTLADRLQPPSPTHLLGTDNLGRDILSRLVFGIRLDIFLGLIVAGIVFTLAVAWSYLGAYVRRSNDWRGDTLEDIIMLPRDVLRSCPWLFLFFFLTSLIVMPDSGTLTSLSMVVAIFAGIVLFPRIISLIQEAVRYSPSGRNWRNSIFLSLPAVFFFAVAGCILYVSSISYYGFGVPPPAPELGGMLSGPARRYMLEAPWMAVSPPTVLVALITIWVLAGESLMEKLGFHSKGFWSWIWE